MLMLFLTEKASIVLQEVNTEGDKKTKEEKGEYDIEEEEEEEEEDGEKDDALLLSLPHLLVL